MELKEPFGRIDKDNVLREKLLPLCRLSNNQVWEDPIVGHKVMVGDATDKTFINKLFGNGELASLAIQDPPYNIVVGNENTQQLSKISIGSYIESCQKWMENTIECLNDNSSIYIWMGADQKEHFQPLPEFMMMMREFSSIKSRSFLTMRNQRGYGTQHNWMAVRQECLYYTVGKPVFNIEAEYTDIPKILKGYYKIVNGEVVDNHTRSKSETIRAGNVWIDVQQVFYRLEENVPGCYAQKPLKAIDRLVKASSAPNDIVLDCFSHSGTTLLAAEINKRRAFVIDIDPIFAELSIRRLEYYRKTGRIGFQCTNPFSEVADLPTLIIDDSKNTFKDDEQTCFL